MTHDEVLALVREVADPRWADPVCSMGDMVTLTLDEMIAFADRVAARERAALAAEPAQPVAWYVERRAPGYGDDGVKSGPWWSKNAAKRFADDHHVLRPLYPADPQPHADVPRLKASEIHELLIDKRGVERFGVELAREVEAEVRRRCGVVE